MLKIDKNTRVKVKKSSSKFDWEKEYMPKPGMLGTEYVGSDRYAVVCTHNFSPKKIGVARLWFLNEDNIKNNKDIHIDEEGVMWMDSDNYEKYGVRNANDIERWSLRTNKITGKNSWHEEGKSRRSSSIHWGIASPYRDMDF